MPVFKRSGQPQHKLHSALPRLAIALAMLGSFGAGLAWPVARASLSQDFAALQQLMGLIRSQALAAPDELSLMRGATQGLVEALDDPYTSYLPPADYAALKEEKSGQVVGIGIELAYREGQVRVMSVLDQTPAAEAGLKPGDLILNIENRQTSELEWHEILRLMQGLPGQPLKLGYQPAGGGPVQTRTLVRDILNLQAVELKALSGDICQLRLRTFFNENLAAQVTAQIAAQPEACATGMILDLRNNPGGLLEQALQLAGLFGIQGTVVQIVSREGEIQPEASVSEALIPEALPIVVLINQGTASAAEVLAAALQESGRAMLMGETSFGKGLVQSLLPLEDGSGLSLTTHRYLTRRGNNLQQAGIHPDIRYSNPDPDQVLRQAQAYLLATAP